VKAGRTRRVEVDGSRSSGLSCRGGEQTGVVKKNERELKKNEGQLKKNEGQKCTCLRLGGFFCIQARRSIQVTVPDQVTDRHGNGPGTTRIFSTMKQDRRSVSEFRHTLGLFLV
jgi:hypothetical protein